jgi:hypothetical protein
VRARRLRSERRRGEPEFVAAWNQRGGKVGDDRLIAWLDENRETFLRALATSDR